MSGYRLMGCLVLGTIVVVGVLVLTNEKEVPSTGGESSTPLEERERVSKAPVEKIEARTDLPSVEARGDQVVDGAQLEIVLTHASDQSPATNVGVIVRMDSMDGGSWDDRRTRSNEDGRCLLDGMPPGDVTVLVDRNVSQRVSLMKGGHHRVALEIPDGIDVRGRVLSQEGTPVPHAQIVTGFEEHHSDLIVAVVTNERGEYVLRDLDPKTLIGARAQGYAPSKIHMFVASNLESTSLDLILGTKAGRLTGSVQDDQGRRLEGALVHFEAKGETSGFRRGKGGSWARDTHRISVRTKASGEFQLTGFRPGQTLLSVRAEGFAPWSKEIAVPASHDGHWDVWLEPAGSIEGVVTDAQGHGVQGVRVSCGQRGPLRNETQTDEDGLYTLEDVAPGWNDVVAIHSTHGSARTRVSVTVGESASANLELVVGLTIRGDLIDPFDRPLEGWEISVQAGATKRTAYTTENGQFEIVNCRDVDHRLEITAPYCAVGSLAIRGVRPGEDRLEIRLKESDLPSAHLRGRLCGPTGEPVSGAKISLFARGRGVVGQGYRSVEKDGSFNFGPLPPGPYFMMYFAEDSPRQEWKSERDLAPDEDRDLGELRLPLGGTVAVQLRFENATRGMTPTLRLRPGPEQTGTAHRLEVSDGEAKSMPVLEGNYVLEVEGEGLVPSRHPVFVANGRVARVDVDIARGVPLVVRLFSKDATPLERPIVLIRDEHGKEVVHRVLWRPDGDNDPTVTVWSLRLREAKYAAEVVCDNGLKGEATFWAREGTTVPIELR